MTTQFKKRFCLFGALLFLCLGAVEATEIVANPQNEEPINEDLLKLMLTGKEKFWESGSEVVIAILKSDPGVDAALSRYSGMTTNKFKNHWQRMAFSGRGKMPKMFSNLEELEAFVSKNEGAIGIVSTGVRSKSLRRIDLGLVISHDESFLFAAASR